jgi:hypothetical protein
MKRGFLFGLGAFFSLGVLGGLDQALRGGDAWVECALTIDDECKWGASAAVMIALSAPLSVLTIWKANAAAPNKSRLHAIGGWLIGLGFFPVVIPSILLFTIFAGAAIFRFVSGLI